MEYSQSQFRLSHVHGIIKNMRVSVVLFTIVALMVVAVMPLHIALAQDPDPNPTRVLPATVYQGEMFNVTVNFTSPTEPTEPTVHFNNAFLTDSAPEGWNVTVDKAWCTPNADNVNATDNQANFTWTGEFSNGTNFTALYKVTVPGDAEPGNYTFSGLLGYYLDGVGSHQSSPITGSSQVEVRPPLIANFTANSTNPCVNTPILFTDSSTGDITSWDWTFEGGSPPSADTQEPHMVTYSAAGSYNVSLTVGNEYGNDTKTETGYIVVKPVPTVNFTVDNTTPCVNTPILFTDSSTGDPTSWRWDFGDGNNSTVQHPTHQYSEVGIYNVSLTVENVCGSNTTTKTNYITVSASPIADFTVDDNTTCVNTSVNFSDLSSGNPTSWLWSFGDGDNSTVQHPSHQYSSAGTYNVSLTVSNACGNDIETKAGYIMVTEEPTANFSAIPTIGCVSLNVTFSDESTGTIDSWSWDVDGDGVEDYSTQNITHTYITAGTYNVSLTVNNTCGSDTKTDYITVYSPSIEVVKTVSPITISSGAQVTYTYNVTNTGDVNLTNVTVDDDKLGNLTSELPDTNLTVDESNSFNVTANPTTTVTNIVNVTGTYAVIVTGLGGGATGGGGGGGGAIKGTVTATDNATVTVARRGGGGGGSGGGGGGGSSSYLDIDMLGKITKVRISYATGTVLKDVVVSDANSTNFVEIDRGTTVICDDTNKAPEALVMRVANQSPPLADGSVIIGSVYNFTGSYSSSSCGHPHALHCCSGVSFDQNITIVLNYDPNELPESTASVAVAYYDAEQGSWISLPTDIGRVAEIGKANGLINHCSAVAIIAELAPPSPASFVANDLNIEQSPQVRKNIFVAVTGEDVTITANVANNGGQEGTYIAELKLNGETVDAKEVTLAAGQSRQVTFILSGMDYGQYEVEVAGLSGEFTVSRSIDGWSIFDIIAGVGLITWGAIWGIRRRKPTQPTQPAQPTQSE